jgi:hypothetical protein
MSLSRLLAQTGIAQLEAVPPAESCQTTSPIRVEVLTVAALAEELAGMLALLGHSSQTVEKEDST